MFLFGCDDIEHAVPGLIPKGFGPRNNQLTLVGESCKRLQSCLDCPTESDQVLIGKSYEHNMCVSLRLRKTHEFAEVCSSMTAQSSVTFISGY